MLLLALVPCGWGGGLEMTGIVCTLELMLLTMAFHRMPMMDLALGLLSFGAGMVFAHFGALPVRAACIDVLYPGRSSASAAFNVAMLRMKDACQMMHFMSPPASVSAGLIVIAIFLQQGFKPESFKALFILAVLTLMNAVVTHATARAFRIRETHNWRALPGEEVPKRSTDKKISARSKGDS